MALNHLELIFLFLLVLIISPDPGSPRIILIISPDPVWLAPPPPPPTSTQLIKPDSPPQQDPSVGAKQESFLVHLTADNVPKVGEYKMITDKI